MAFVIGSQHLGPLVASRLLDPYRHIPNYRVVDIRSELVDDPTLPSVFQQWLTDNRHIRLSDHVDEIEREYDEAEARCVRNRIVQSP